uniref:Uncharacterized protein n=1 Tax=Plectus sambesii TaxID=2011161 RepID=A0A914VI99_9BILA
MVDAYTAAVKVWHTEAGRRQDDADIKVQLDRSDLLKTKLFIRPALNRDLIKKAGELQTSVQNVQRSNVVRESLQSLTASQKLMLEDFARNMQPMMEGWAEEQRTLAEEMGAGYQELLDNIEIYTQLTKEIVWACLDLINQAIEQIAAELPNPAVGEYYRQLKDWTA